MVKRPDREILMEIRSGKWSYEKLINHTEKINKELDDLYKNCKILPKSPNMEKIDALCIKLVEKSLSKYSYYNIKKKIKSFLD